MLRIVTNFNGIGYLRAYGDLTMYASWELTLHSNIEPDYFCTIFFSAWCYWWLTFKVPWEGVDSTNTVLFACITVYNSLPDGGWRCWWVSRSLGLRLLSSLIAYVMVYIAAAMIYEWLQWWMLGSQYRYIPETNYTVLFRVDGDHY